MLHSGLHSLYTANNNTLIVSFFKNSDLTFMSLKDQMTWNQKSALFILLSLGQEAKISCLC